MRHVRDGGLGVPEERETRHPHPPRGCQKGRQAWDARPHARSVRTRNRSRNREVINELLLYVNICYFMLL